MFKSTLVSKINRFFAAIASEDYSYNDCHMTMSDFKDQDKLSEIAYLLRDNYFTYEEAPELLEAVESHLPKASWGTNDWLKPNKILCNKVFQAVFGIIGIGITTPIIIKYGCDPYAIVCLILSIFIAVWPVINKD